MNTLKELYDAISIVMKGKKTEKCPIPLFSFEGLPGAGKTTQIKLVSEILRKKYGIGKYVELPTDSPIGTILRTLYRDENTWLKVRDENPWLNPIFLSVDLRHQINEAINIGSKYILMSRGILSTYYYNIEGYKGDNLDEKWKKINKDLLGFYPPTAIIFLDLPEHVAHKRVVKRNRGPLRKMDSIESMNSDRKIFTDFINRLEYIPVHYINANNERNIVTNEIVKVVERYLENGRN